MALRCGHKGTSQKVFPAANKTRQPCDPDGQGPQRPPELLHVPSADRYQCLLLMKPCDMRAEVKGCRLTILTAECTSHSPKTMCAPSLPHLSSRARGRVFFLILGKHFHQREISPTGCNEEMKRNSCKKRPSRE